MEELDYKRLNIALLSCSSVDFEGMSEEKEEESQQEEESLQEEEKDEGNDNPRVIRQLPNMVCRDGLTLLAGTVVLTEHEITLTNATQIRGRIDLNSPAPDQDSSSPQGINSNTKSISIPLESLESITYGTVLGRPALVFGWKDNTRSFAKARRTEFIQRAGKGKEMKENRLVNWVPVIDEAKNVLLNPSQKDDGNKEQQEQSKEEEGATANATQTATIPIDTSKLESEIVSILDKKDWKGPFQIANELRDTYGGKYDFDLVETLCKKLAKNKVIEGDKAGEFFRKAKN